MLRIEKFTFGPFQVNTYILFDEETKDTLIIDPGNVDPYEDEMIFSFIEKEKLIPAGIILTHSHIDHIIGVKAVKDKYNCRLIASEKDMPLFLNAAEQGRLFGINVPQLPLPDSYFDENVEIKIGNIGGRFLFTPGHTPGEYCIYFENQRILISGDVIFKETIGRTDLWGGNFKQLINSIENKILNLPDDVVIYSGHGDETTISHEKQFNPYITGNL